MTEQLLENAITQKRALMQQLLTGKRRFSEFERQPWREVRLDEIVDGIPGGGTPDKSNPAYWNGEIPWASVKDLKSSCLLETRDSITEAGLNNSASKAFPEGTIVISTRMAVGVTVMLGRRMAINQDLKAIIPGPQVRNRYLFHFLQMAQSALDALGTGSTVKGITLGDIRGLVIGLPEDLAEQMKISEAIDAASSEVSALQDSIEKLRTEKKALMQQLLTGKRRVKIDA